MFNELPLFQGATFNPKRDGSRLAEQLLSVKRLMADGQWRTLEEISATLGHPQASVSARLRDLRKSQHGGFRVDREYVANGLWRYRLWHE